MPHVQGLTARLSGIGIAGGVLVVGALEQLGRTDWGLTIGKLGCRGARAGGSTCMRHGSFAFLLKNATSASPASGRSLPLP